LVPQAENDFCRPRRVSQYRIEGRYIALQIDAIEAGRLAK
jgi:hypothetical protein